MKTPARKKTALLITVAVLGLVTGFALNAGRMLVIDEPRTSDVILVLAGETEHRPARALQLLGEGYTRKIVIDVPAEGQIYGFSPLELARRYAEDLSQKASINICPIEGLSTKDEVRDAERCLAREGAKSVLIVTSDFHTRRALHIFQEKSRESAFPWVRLETASNLELDGGLIGSGPRLSCMNGCASSGGRVWIDGCKQARAGLSSGFVQ